MGNKGGGGNYANVKMQSSLMTNQLYHATVY